MALWSKQAHKDNDTKTKTYVQTFRLTFKHRHKNTVCTHEQSKYSKETHTQTPIHNLAKRSKTQQKQSSYTQKHAYKRRDTKALTFTHIHTHAHTHNTHNHTHKQIHKHHTFTNGRRNTQKTLKYTHTNTITRKQTH